jgi:uncharacterized protein (DUF924 family)
MTTTTNDPWVAEVLGFWFGDLGRAGWFRKDAATDSAIRERFAPLIDEIDTRALEDLVADADRALASVIVLDQFTRNIYRDSPHAFAYDDLARAISKLAIAVGLDQRLPVERRIFLYLPLEHSEAIVDQYRSVELISALGDEEYTRYAKAHCDVIERFGRFPHRNAVLGRTSTSEEDAFLQEPGSRF